jgi:DNA-binding GntR family transcriptional regulator
VEPIDIEGVRASAAGRRLTERPPLADDVHDVLVDMLMNHTLAPGSRLNIEVLAKTLGVSPTPVREALARVEAEGLVVKEPRRGYLVAPLISLEDLHSLIDFRLLVEPEAAAAAARRATPEQAARLQELVRLRSHLHMYRLYYHARQGAATNVEHEIIADAIASGDLELAATAMRDHLHTAIKRIDDVFASGRAQMPA